MMKETSIQLMVLFIIMMVPFMITMASYAQETDNTKKEAVTLPTQTVTAQKREEVLQKVPIAVASIDSTKTEELQIGNINEVGRISPNFKSYDDGGGLFPMIASRGLFTIDEVPVVGVYVDDVPLFNTTSFPTLLTDIDRIEVLRGPQGTLYGRNTLAGAINVITKHPTNETKGFASFGYGNLNQIEASAGVNISLIEDKLFARISGSSTFRDGYIENTFLETNNLLEHEQYGGNLRLTYFPSSSLSLTLNTSLTQREVDAYAFVGGFGLTGEDVLPLLKEAPYQVAFNTQGVYDTLTSNNALKLSYETDHLSIKSITSLQYTDNTGEGDDFDFSPLAINKRTLSSRGFTTFAEEIRVSSKDSRLRWLAGVFVYNLSTDYVHDWEAGKDNAAFQQDPDVAAQYPYITNDKTEQRYTGFSVFGNADYPIIERLRVIAGIRFEIENNHADVSRSYTKNGNTGYQYPNLGAIPAEFEETATFNATSPKVGLSYDPTDDLMFFTNVARGYRPGGINPFTTDAETAKFDPEFSWNYEAGVKSMFLQNRVRANLTGFYIDYRDQQLYTLINLETFNIGRANLGRSISYGTELETEWALIEGLTAIINIGYLETEITDYKTIGPGGELDNAGNEQGYSPHFNGNFGISYERPINSLITLKATADYQYQTDMFFDAENTLEQKAYGLLNARFVVSTERADLILWGQNLMDEIYLSYGYGLGGAGVAANYGLPRTFGSKLFVKF
ncbi:TonB-dependent receptor [Candidatus Poribacteria bacterium]|nr:TonB-dependent receptor [Candidatus Poribacteria bacterium]